MVFRNLKGMVWIYDLNNINFCVTQGSVLGPFLCLISADLPVGIHRMNATFDDDTELFTRDNNPVVRQKTYIVIQI